MNSTTLTDLADDELNLKQRLELYVEWVQSPNLTLQEVGVACLRQEIQAKKYSNPLVLLPLKFLQAHFQTLKACFETMSSSYLKKHLAGILSFLALPMAGDGKMESLEYVLLSHMEDINSWGDIYIRNLARELQEANNCGKLKSTQDTDVKTILQQIIQFFLQCNAEHEAVDYVLEFDTRGLFHIFQLVDSTNYKKTCLYLTNLARYLGEEDAVHALDTACQIYCKFREYSDALRVAMSLGNVEVMQNIISSCELLEQKQLCFIVAQHGIWFELDHDIFEDLFDDDDLMAEMESLISNQSILKFYLLLVNDMGLQQSKSPEDIYKVTLRNLEPNFGKKLNHETLAALYVNAFVNAAYSSDKWLIGPDGTDLTDNHVGNDTLPSVGLILLWNVDLARSEMKHYIKHYGREARAGALLGLAVSHSGFRRPRCFFKPELKYFSEYFGAYMENDPLSLTYGAIGLGIAYIGSEDPKVIDILCDLVKQKRIEYAELSLGLVCIGSCDKKASDAILHALREMAKTEWDPFRAKLLIIGLGLIYLGKKEKVETIDLEFIPVAISKFCQVILQSCAYAGTGDVITIQNLLRHCEEDIEGFDHQRPAVLGIALVAIGEEVGQAMVFRALGHLLQYGEPNIRRAVPLAMALLSVSNPQERIRDILGTLSHDKVEMVAQPAIIALGLIGAGTNNRHIRGLLQNLSEHYRKNVRTLFIVRIAQGLLHLGKGLLTLSPLHSDGYLCSPTALAGLMTFLQLCLLRYLPNQHYLLYYLAIAMKPRMLMTLDEDMNLLPVPVRVGKAVDVVCRAGQPRTVNGFRTLTTPIVLAAGERAELATEEYIPLSPILDGVVILKRKR